MGEKFFLKKVNKQLKSADFFSKMSKFVKNLLLQINWAFLEIRIHCVNKPDYFCLPKILRLKKPLCHGGPCMKIWLISAQDFIFKLLLTVYLI